MRLSTKGRMAVTAMVDLGLRADAAPVPLAALSARHSVSMSYLEQLFSGLRKHQLVHSTRGPGGGYRLARDGHSISVADIILAVEDPMARTANAQAPRRQDEARGPQQIDGGFWIDLHSKIGELLATVSLQSLVAEQRARGGVVEASQSKRVHSPFRRLPSPAAVLGPNSVFALGQFAR